MKRFNFIKSVALVAAVGIVGMLQSCTNGLKSLHFNLGMQTQTVTITIPPTTGGTISVGPISTSYNVDSFIRAQTGQQLGINNIYSVKLASCVITITNPTADNNFANFQSCTASFTSNTNSTPYVLTINNNPDTYQNTLSLPVDANAELKTYLGDQFQYNFTGTLRRPITTTLTCTVTFNYNLVVQG